MTRLVDLTGQRFGRLTAIERVENRGQRTFWRFECDCGASREIWAASVQRGATRSCGCLQAERRYGRLTHGRSGSPEFRSWASAKGRCLNPRNAAYPHYGGRGITMSPRWSASFEAFLADMGERPPNTSLDRIDNDGPYSPENCRWATRTQQARNKRTSVFVEHNGERMPLKAFAALMGVGYTRLHGRMTEKGETPHEAAAAMRSRHRQQAFVGRDVAHKKRRRHGV